ncbi:MAG: hypothetical protein QOJ13_2675, partial [Gaiellales bacterium]|nr:hypothetical protein [Gaiellales bacterium]
MRVAYAVLVFWVLVGEVGNLAGGPAFLRPFFGPAGQIVAVLVCSLLTGLRAMRISEERRPWALLSVGIAAWGFGNVYWAVVLAHEAHVPVPSPADIGYVLFPLLAIAAVVSLRRPGHRLRPAQWFDASAAALAVASAALVIVWETIDSVGHGATLEIITSLSYPATNLLLLGLVVGSAARDGWEIGRRFGLLLAGIAILVVTNSVYAADNLHGGYAVGDWYDMGWATAVLLMSAASWQPHSVSGEGHTARQLTMPIVFALVALSVLGLETVSRVAPMAAVLAIAALLALLGRLAVTLRENVGMLSSSRVEALSDPLTGLGNRRAFERDLGRRLQDLTPGETLTLALFDLDGFKNYNDRFGHPAGDALLVRLSQALLGHLGDEGVAFRMGGDEFCVLRTAHSRQADRLSAAAAESLTESGQGFQVGCSFGCVTIPDDADDASAALRLADQRLYAAKPSGRSSTSRQTTDALL